MDHKRRTRRNHILYLIELYLNENGFKETAQCLKTEAKLCDNKKICDNVNLETIVIEYESFFFHRFKKYPQLCKTVNLNDHQRSGKFISGTQVSKPSETDPDSDEESLRITGDAIIKPRSIDSEAVISVFSENEFHLSNCRNNGIQKTNRADVSIHWKDIKGLENEKEILKEAITYPMKYPHLFQASIESWKSVLLYGPPGTGKTLLARATASESCAIFFNVSASSVVSKWRGDTEKYLRALFDAASRCAPSVIFIDEFDSFALRRDSSDHEASRRMKSELFVRIDEVIREGSKIFLLAATNTPWDLDESMLRRFEKHIYVGPPDETVRREMFESFLPKVICEKPRIEVDVNFQYVAQLTEDYSGCEIKNLCKEIKMNRIRKIVKILEANGSVKQCLDKTNITTIDVETEIMNFKPLLLNLKSKYIDWKRKQSSCTK